MAFCTNCGKSLEDGARFCTNCGTPRQVSATAPVAISSPSAAAAPATAVAPLPEPTVPAHGIQEVQPEMAAELPAATPETAPSVPYDDFGTTHQSSISPVFVIICIVLLLLIAGGIAGTVYFQRQGRAKTAAPQIAAETPQAGESPKNSSSTPAPGTAIPASTPSVSSPSPATPVPVPSVSPVADSVRAMNLGNYPGATPVAIATLTGETVVAGFLTRDTPQQVIQFYKIRFPVSTMAESGGKAELSATLPGGERIRIQAQPQGADTQVIVLQEK